MGKDEFIAFISKKMKLVRMEHDYTQDKMADVLGISKKTLVQIEKGRILAGWTTVVAFCALFNKSELLLSSLGDEPLYLAQMYAFKSEAAPYDRTMGGKVWWKLLEEREGYRLQQNLISNHYRILDEDNYRWYSSFEKEEAMKRLNELAERRP